MQWKVLAAFGTAFTVLFVLVAIWILRFTTGNATDRVEENLRSITVGGAATIDAERFAELAVRAGPVDFVSGDRYPSNAGYLAGTAPTSASEWPVDADYWDHVNELADIRATNPEASPYSFVVGDDGDIRFIGSWGALGFPTSSDPPDGARYGQPAGEVVPPETLDYFARGAVETTEQPRYTDEFGTWVSAYTPIVDAAGTTVGVLGVDYPLSYVEEVRSDVVRVLYPVFAGAYVVLLVIVVMLSRSLTRRLSRLSLVSRRVADGDYEVDVSEAARSRFPDEMTELAESFGAMAEKVGARERSLVRQVQVLKVEIDEAKRSRDVADITETEFFTNLTSAAAAMRAKVRRASTDTAPDDDEDAGDGEGR
jgi:HAMP domain-containing protein